MKYFWRPNAMKITIIQLINILQNVKKYHATFVENKGSLILYVDIFGTV